MTTIGLPTERSLSSYVRLLASLPLDLTYDLSRMESQVHVTLPPALGGVSANLRLAGIISGSMRIRIQELEGGGLRAVLTGLEVSVGRIRLPLGGPLRLFHLVTLALEEASPAAVDPSTGQFEPLTAVLRVRSPHILARAMGGTRLSLSLTERLGLADWSLHGSGVGRIDGGFLKGTIFTFSHAKPPPPPPPPPKYCVYQVVGHSSGQFPDIICVTCPGTGRCQGDDQTAFNATVRDPSGATHSVQLKNQHGDHLCHDCPSDESKGYTII